MSTTANPVRQLENFGQSVWLDYIRRKLLFSEEYRRLLDEDGLKGMTSNPTIFEKAIGGSDDYDEQFNRVAKSGATVDALYEALTTEDIKTAADKMRPIYDRTEGRDGFISYEVSPLLANDTDGTIAAAHRYFAMINRPNLMIKVPATPAGIPAIEQLISEGHNINITLMFSLKHYVAVAEAYLRGLERRVKGGQPIDRVASVASVFVSRVETLVDKRLDEKLKAHADEAIAALRGTAAVAGTRLIYQKFKEIFGSDRFKALAAKGARVQRPLWASTGTKNPAYSDIKYVQDLIGPDTVNTMPPATMDAYRDHGKPRVTVEEDLAGARDTIKRLAGAGIDLDQIGDELQVEGVDLFSKSFDDLLAVIKGRLEAMTGGSQDRQKISAGRYADEIKQTAAKLDKEELSTRLWRKDASLWKKDADHQKIINNALGWLNVPELMAGKVNELSEFADEIRKGIRDVVLLGMGGSSLCPEVFAQTFHNEPGYPRLHVLDSTIPAQIAALESRIDPVSTLFVVSSKSGGTVETLSHCAYFYAKLAERWGITAGRNFIAITDPGTNLEKLATDHHFRRSFLNPHDIGGRYSALSYFGLVPAALIGMDVKGLLQRAIRMQQSCGPAIHVAANPGLGLGAALGALQKAGRDKVTFVVSPPIATFGLWVEQLIAESTGKESTGLIPICDEPLGAPGSYGTDRVFVYLRLEHEFDPSQDAAVDALEASGAPVVRIALPEPLDLGDEFMRWEIATATAGVVLGIDAFDQPNVQESKDNTGRLLKQFEQTHALPADKPSAEHGALAIFCPPATRAQINSTNADFDNLLKGFLHLAQPGNYFATMAYVTPSLTVEREIGKIRALVRDRFKIATTFGYGPRFLHSTGQLHKGGPNTGLFLQITQDHQDNPPIPGAPYGFATLNQAQYLGDYQALQNHGRRVLRLHLHGDPDAAIAAVRHAIADALA